MRGQTSVPNGFVAALLIAVSVLLVENRMMPHVTLNCGDFNLPAQDPGVAMASGFVTTTTAASSTTVAKDTETTTTSAPEKPTLRLQVAPVKIDDATKESPPSTAQQPATSSQAVESKPKKGSSATKKRKKRRKLGKDNKDAETNVAATPVIAEQAESKDTKVVALATEGSDTEAATPAVDAPQEARKDTKLFGLGLSKTATSSMGDAMDLLGYKTIHCDRALGHFMHYPDVSPDLSGVYDQVDSVWDIPTAAYYKELHQAYPNAKFVLTVRNATTWYKSFKKYHLENYYYQQGCAIPERVKRLHNFVYGSRELNPSWIDAMERHNKDVQDYFKDFPDQLRVIDIEKDNLWEQLCDFTGVSDGPCTEHTKGIYPDFPSSNSAAANEVPKVCKKSILPDGDHKPSKYAYVTILCDAINDTRGVYMRMVIVLALSIREFDQENDIVVLVKGQISGKQKKMLTKYGIRIAYVGKVGGRVQYEDPFGRVPEGADTCFMAKLRALQLLQYEKVMFADSDMIFESDPRALFQEQGFLGFQGPNEPRFGGPGEPLNGGLYVMTPSHQTFVDMEDIHNSGSYEPDNGWLSYGPIHDWPKAGETHDWRFWCAHSDQGLVYYYFDKVAQIANIRPREEHYGIFFHFFGNWHKPFEITEDRINSIPRQDPTVLRKAWTHWHKLWDDLTQKDKLKIHHYKP